MLRLCCWILLQSVLICNNTTVIDKQVHQSMSLHGIVGPKFTQIWWNKWPLTRPIIVPNFVTLRQKVCEIFTVENFAPGKVDQTPPKSLKTCYVPMLLIMKFNRAQANNAQEKCYNCFYTLQYLKAPGRPSGPKFANLGPDVHQGSLYQYVKYRAYWTTCLQDICYQSLSISLTAWLTDNKKTVNKMSP